MPTVRYYVGTFWPMSRFTLFFLALAGVAPAVFSLGSGDYFYALVIWPISVLFALVAVAVVPPGVAVLITRSRLNALRHVRDFEFDTRNRRQVWIAAAGFAALAAWEVVRAFWDGDRDPVLSIGVGLLIDVVLLYLLGRREYRRGRIGLHATLDAR